MITQKFNIYLHAGIGVAPVVHASQYSQGETWTFTILDNDGSVYRPSSGALIGLKSDGRVIAGITGTVNADGSVSIVTTQQLTAAAGRGVFELTIDGGTNGTANFIVEVEKKPTDGGVLSESDLSIIQQGINSVTPAVIQETVSDYLEEHMTNPPIDPTLTVSNAAADAKVTGDKIADLKNAFDDIAIAKTEQQKTTPTNTWTSGLWWNKSSAASTSYAYSSEITVSEGDVISVEIADDTVQPMRFIEGYDADGNIEAQVSSDTNSYTVPSGVVKLRVTVYSVNISQKTLYNLTRVALGYKVKTDAVINLPAFMDGVGYSTILKSQRIADNVWTSGIWWNKTASANTSYVYSSEITVAEGDVVNCQTANGTVKAIRFIEGYDKNGNIVAQNSSDVTSYTIPSGCTSVRLTPYAQSAEQLMIVILSSENTYEVKEIESESGIVAEFASVGANAIVALSPHLDNKKNCEYSFFGRFGSFTSLKIAHDEASYNGYYLVIDSANITVYSHSGTQMQQFAHGLTFIDFISVSVKVADTQTARASVTIQTNGGYYETTNVIFFGCNGSIFAETATAMTDVKFSYTIMDLKKDVYIFGDSYIALADNTKWPYYAIGNGDNNMLLCGFGGATSMNEILSFRRIMMLSRPKYLCWFLGMNDADSGAINANWKSCIDEVIDYCDSNNIEVVLATIPNTPSVNNTYKNAYVKGSGKRYVDFAKAVGAETSGSTWYTGMLSSDNVHPTAEGAKALWLRMRLDCPEIIN